jgi:hypothetical protein
VLERIANALGVDTDYLNLDTEGPLSPIGQDLALTPNERLLINKLRKIPEGRLRSSIFGLVETGVELYAPGSSSDETAPMPVFLKKNMGAAA